MRDTRTDVGIELKMLSLDSGILLERLILDYWHGMLESEHIEDYQAREILVINCLGNIYLPDTYE